MRFRPLKRRTPLEAIAKFCRKCAGGTRQAAKCPFIVECPLHHERLFLPTFSEGAAARD